MVRAVRTAKESDKAGVRVARAGAKLVIELDAAGQTDAARRIREITAAAVEAMRAPTPAREPAAPAPVLTAEHLHTAAQSGVTAFGPGAATPKVLLASLGLDLGRADVCADLVALHQRREIRLARVDYTAGVVASLAERGIDDALLYASEIRTPDGSATFHVLALA
jgi:hypothetical protein